MSNIPFPQANSVDKLITFLMMFKNLSDKKTIAQEMLIHPRQVDYYMNAWRFLCVITINKFGGFEISEKGILLLDASINLRKKLFKEIINNQPELNQLFSKKDINIDNLANLYPDLSLSTQLRRLSTLKAWKNWIEG
jgi:hypothetical protein